MDEGKLKKKQWVAYFYNSK